MAAVGVVASLAALLAANGTSVLDCLCEHVGERSSDEATKLFDYCHITSAYGQYAPCDSVVPSPVAAAVLDRLLPPIWWGDRAPPLVAADRECGRAVAEIRRLPWPQKQRLYWHLDCRVAADCIRSCPRLRLVDTEWTATTLASDHVRRGALLQHRRAVSRITTAKRARWGCEIYSRDFRDHLSPDKTELLERYSSYWRDSAQLLSLGVTLLSRLFVPLAFEVTGNHTNDENLHRWIKNAERLRHMLDTRLRGWVDDVQTVSELVQNYKIEENKTSPGKYILRRPLLSENLLKYQPRFLSFREDYTAVCEERQPDASQMFSVADMLYPLWYQNCFKNLPTFTDVFGHQSAVIDEQWQLEDKSNDTLTVDAGCLQLLVEAVERPTCPLEDLPLETIEKRQQCRRQLWDDMVQGSPRVPVTSYLAYTQRASVHLCLLAWMADHPFGVCQDVPFSVIQSVHDARCYFDRPGDKSCLQSDAKDAFCVVSRAILLLKCRDFSSYKIVNGCYFTSRSDGSWSFNEWKFSDIAGVKPTDRILNYISRLRNTSYPKT